jgi:hypothetical protein
MFRQPSGRRPGVPVYGRQEGKKASAIPYAELLEAHIADYRALYGRCDLDLGRSVAKPTGTFPT